MLRSLVSAAPDLFDGVSWAQVSGGISLLITAALAGLSVRKSIRENKADARREILESAGSGEQRESVAVGTTERAVLVLDKALSTVQAQHERDMEQAQREIERLRVIREREVARMQETIDRQRDAFRRSQDAHERCSDRLVARDEVIRELNDRVAVLAHELGAAQPKRLVVRADDDAQLEVDTAVEEAAVNACPIEPEEVSDEPGPSGIGVD